MKKNKHFVTKVWRSIGLTDRLFFLAQNMKGRRCRERIFRSGHGIDQGIIDLIIIRRGEDYIKLKKSIASKHREGLCLKL